MMMLFLEIKVKMKLRVKKRDLLMIQLEVIFIEDLWQDILDKLVYFNK